MMSFQQPRGGSPQSELKGSGTSSISLSVNYLPTKFSSSMLSPSNPRKRKGGKPDDLSIPKRGGGVEAFKSGEARIPGENDDDYDGVSSGWFGADHKNGRAPRKLHWNRFKTTLFFANVLFSAYSLVGLVLCLLTWFGIWKDGEIILVANREELVVSTVAASFAILTSVVGWAGILLNNRSFLAVYTFLLWICFALLVIPGYMTFRRKSLNLEGKINLMWSRNIGALGRLKIQNHLSCCGYFSPFVEATVSQTCYARSNLPGCKLPFLEYQRMVLTRWYTVAFAVVPLQIAVMLAGLLCSNHVTYRFGKGMMPKAYRLSMNSMAVIMDNYANQLAEQYGPDVASEVLARSRSNLHAMPYSSNSSNASHGNSKYDQLGSRAPDGTS